MKVIKLDNRLADIKKIYKLRNIRSMSLAIRKFLAEYSKEEHSNHLYFKDRKSESNCDAWHVDGYGEKDMIIASYPYPTQILLYKDSYKNWHICNNQINLRAKRANKLIYEGSAKIFTPEPGDVYYLGYGVIHRTNPAALGGAHLVIRQWNPCLLEKYRNMVYGSLKEQRPVNNTV